MTIELLIKGFFTLIFSGIFAWVVFDRDFSGSRDSNRQRYLPYISGLMLPICMLTLIIFFLFPGFPSSFLNAVGFGFLPAIGIPPSLILCKIKGPCIFTQS